MLGADQDAVPEGGLHLVTGHETDPLGGYSGG